MTWPVWVLILGIAASIVCMLYGAIAAFIALRNVKAHAERLQALPLIADAAEASVYVERINHAVEQIDVLLIRAQAAVSELHGAIEELRIPEAIFAIRAAGASIRLLFSGR